MKNMIYLCRSKGGVIIHILNTDLHSSRIAFGADVKVSNEEFDILLDKYIDLGGNHIDTAVRYSNGKSEEFIGRWMKSRNMRNRIVLATKGGLPGGEKLEISRLNREELEKDLDNSLRLLATDYIDIYYLHRDDTNTRVEDIMDILFSFVRKGKIRYLGCSNWTAERIKKANDYAERRGKLGFSISQIRWSLAKVSPTYNDDKTLVEMNDEQYRFYAESNLPVAAFSPQAKGYFSKLAASGELDSKTAARYDSDENRRRFDRVRQLAAEKSVSPAAVALAYLRCAPIQVIPVVGCNSLPRLRECMSAIKIHLTPDERGFLDAD